MPNPLYKQALAIVQEHNIAVIACGEDKAPIHMGWRQKATRDPKKLKQIFSDPKAALIGVPCGELNDLMVFDLDYREGNTPERNAKLQEFEDDLRATYSDAEIRVHRTRNGGKHIIMLNAEGRLPRNIMPKLELVYEGFQFIWPTEDSGYTVEIDTPLDQLAEPVEGFLQVRERMEGLSKSGGLMTSEMADRVMRSDGEVGTRHDAMLRLTQDFVAAVPKDKLKDPRWVASTFEELFRADYGDCLEPSRLEELLNWREENGELYGSDLGNALKKPLEARVRQEFAGDRLREAMAKAGADTSPFIAALSTPVTAAPSKDEFVEIDLDELKQTELPDIDFIIDDVFPSRNLIGLAGPSGAGKTRFTAALVAAMASGNTDIIGLPKANRAVRTLYCANEERAEDLQRRIKAAALLNDMPTNMHLVVRGKDHGTLKLVDAEGNINKKVIEFLIEKANAEQIELIIFDPFVTLGSAEENAAEGVAVVIDAMQQITQESGAAVMFIHHTPKGDRSAPADEMRGSDAAFRGSGAIFSSLDVGLTLFPYLPPRAHDPKDGKGYRRALLSAQRAKSVPKYIVLDPAKNREGDAITPVIYQLAAHEVRVGGKPIGAIKLVDYKEADWACDRAVELGRGNRDMVLSIEVGRVLAEHWGVGQHKTSLTELLDYLAENLSVWAEEKGKIRADRGQGGKLMELLATPIQSGTVSVSLERDGKVIWLKIV